jgi:hypothetical protein
MQSPGESAHAYHLLLRSDLFRYHSERMINLILAEAEEVRSDSSLFFLASCSNLLLTRPSVHPQNRNPNTLYILYNILLLWGTKHYSLFRSHRRWKRLAVGLGGVFTAEVDEVNRPDREPGITFIYVSEPANVEFSDSD